MAKEVELTQGYVTTIDDEDYPKLGGYSWKVLKTHKSIYASRTKTITEDGRKTYKTILLHRVILGIEDGTIKIDHKDGNGLNNQKSNLRVATDSQNQWNRGKDVDAVTSSKRGVYWNRQRGKWQAQIGYNNRVIYIGRFSTEEEAAAAYDKAAITIHGEFASINQLKPDSYEPPNIEALVQAQRGLA